MAFPSLVAVLSSPDRASASIAFETSFGIEPFSVTEEYMSSIDQHGKIAGCNAPSVKMNIHCSQPHLECAAHVLPSSCGFKVSDAIMNGEVENSLLITPDIIKLKDSGETYPVGDLNDYVISRKSLESALARSGDLTGVQSLIIRVENQFLSLRTDKHEILNWPYLTLECASFIHSQFRHIRTNLPSVERPDSKAGMWSHNLIFFGSDECTNFAQIRECPRKTIGELFFIPSAVADGRYSLICPFVEMGLDCAITSPLLYRR
jgi:hypothetical protein